MQVLKAVRQSLKDLLLAVEGTIIMTPALKSTMDAMFDARVPEKWRKVSFLKNARFLFALTATGVNILFIYYHSLPIMRKLANQHYSNDLTVDYSRLKTIKNPHLVFLIYTN